MIYKLSIQDIREVLDNLIYRHAAIAIIGDAYQPNLDAL